jgi:hypothetical protein
MLAELDPARLEDFARRLASQACNRLDQQTVWTAFAAAFPGRPQGVEERRWLRAALEELAARGLLRLPSVQGRRWDKTLGVAIPTSLDLVRQARVASTGAWRAFPWHPRLQWVTDLGYLTPEQETFLYRVHRGLVEGWFQTLAPFKYRSLQLTGQEKKLYSFLGTKLFDPSRLTTDLLGCSAEIVPLAWEAVSNKPALVIFENAGPFAVARTVLAKMSDPPYGIVGYGGGTRFERSVAHLLTIGRRVEQIEYVGDLDWDGLRIAVAGQSAAHVAGLPGIRPARSIHRAMLAAASRFGNPHGWPAPIDSRPDPQLVHFLPQDVRGEALHILQAGHRIPEEVLGPVELGAVWGSN